MGYRDDGRFEGICDECGDVAVAHATASTALIERKSTGQYSAVRTKIVRCRQGHSYYILDLETEVKDPFGGDTPIPEDMK